MDDERRTTNDENCHPSSFVIRHPSFVIRPLTASVNLAVPAGSVHNTLRT